MDPDSSDTDEMPEHRRYNKNIPNNVKEMPLEQPDKTLSSIFIFEGMNGAELRRLVADHYPLASIDQNFMKLTYKNIPITDTDVIKLKDFDHLIPIVQIASDKKQSVGNILGLEMNKYLESSSKFYELILFQPDMTSSEFYVHADMLGADLFELIERDLEPNLSLDSITLKYGDIEITNGFVLTNEIIEGNKSKSLFLTQKDEIRNPDMIYVTFKNFQNSMKKPKSFNVRPNTTIAELKSIIYERHCKTLKVEQMSLTVNGNLMDDDVRLNSPGSTLAVQQNRKTIDKIQGLQVTNQIDPITEQNRTVKLKCGHYYGEIGMREFVKINVATMNVSELRCRNQLAEKHEYCGVMIEESEWQQIGVFTREDCDFYSRSLLNNSVKFISKVCPNGTCGNRIFKSSLGKSKRFTCSKCGSISCYLCLEKWNSPNDKDCGNERIEGNICGMVTVIRNLPRVHTFNFEGENIQIRPKRLCPTCNATVELIIQQGVCKHVYHQCGVPFCYCCARTLKDKWQCGSSYSLCSKYPNENPIIVFDE